MKEQKKKALESKSGAVLTQKLDKEMAAYYKFAANSSLQARSSLLESVCVCVYI